MTHKFLLFLVTALLLCSTSTIYAQDELHKDCVTALDVSDESVLIYHQFSPGAGEDPSEMDDAPCLPGIPNFETNSFWMKWTAKVDGEQVFTIWPQFETDDIDFVLYEMIEDDCTQKQAIRCMAAGDFNFPSDCMGPTGLDYGNFDESEQVGCMGANHNNFLAPLVMTTGRTYLLGINNFTSTNGGFSIAFCGTASTPSAMSDCLVLSDVNSFDNEQALEVFPNPSRDGIFYVNLPKAASEKDEIEVYDLLGRKILTQNIQKYSTKATIDLSTHTNRIFFLKIRLNNRIFAQQILNIK